jgi:hypothetical protein
MSSVPTSLGETLPTDVLSEPLRSKLSNPETNSDFDLYHGVNQVLKDVGMTAADSGGSLSFYAQDPIIPSRIRFGTMAAIGLASKAVAIAALWRSRTGEGQDISVDVRKALRRFCGFVDRKWETINGRPPAVGADALNPFLQVPLFRETRDGRHVVALNICPKVRSRALKFLKCHDSVEGVQSAILQWRADELETAAAEAGLIIARSRLLPIVKLLGAKKVRAGRVLVGPIMNVRDVSGVFVVGDATSIMCNGRPLPGVAQTIQEGRYVGQLISQQLEGRQPKHPFRYFDRGNMAVVGKNFPILESGRLRMSGFVTWLVWVFLHVMSLPQLQNRFRVQNQWLWFYFTGQRSSELIPELPKAGTNEPGP